MSEVILSEVDEPGREELFELCTQLVPARQFALDRDIVEWSRSGKFVLWWGSDLWMDADGNVVAT